MISFRKSFSYVAVLSCLFIFNSCQKKKTIDKNLGRIWQCSKTNAPDSVSVAAQLTGAWKWVEMSSEKCTKKANQTVLLMFDKNGTYQISEDAKATITGTWTLRPSDDHVFSLTISTPSFFCQGQVLICDDELLFYGSDKDGSDQLFIRN